MAEKSQEPGDQRTPRWVIWAVVAGCTAAVFLLRVFVDAQPKPNDSSPKTTEGDRSALAGFLMYVIGPLVFAGVVMLIRRNRKKPAIETCYVPRQIVCLGIVSLGLISLGWSGLGFFLGLPRPASLSVGFFLGAATLGVFYWVDGAWRRSTIRMFARFMFVDVRLAQRAALRSGHVVREGPTAYWFDEVSPCDAGIKEALMEHLGPTNVNASPTRVFCFGQQAAFAKYARMLPEPLRSRADASILIFDDYGVNRVLICRESLGRTSEECRDKLISSLQELAEGLRKPKG